MSKDRKELIQMMLGVLFLMLILISGIIYGIMAKEYMVAGLSILVLVSGCVMMANAGIWEDWKKAKKKE